MLARSRSNFTSVLRHDRLQLIIIPRGSSHLWTVMVLGLVDDWSPMSTAARNYLIVHTVGATTLLQRIAKRVDLIIVLLGNVWIIVLHLLNAWEVAGRILTLYIARLLRQWVERSYVWRHICSGSFRGALRWLVGRWTRAMLDRGRLIIKHSHSGGCLCCRSWHHSSIDWWSHLFSVSIG